MKNNTQPTAAQMLRKDLKEAFPGQKFSVTSDYNSIRVKYTDGVSSDKVEKLTGKYEMGHFNGSEDIYEYSNVNKDIPQVKYVFVEREMSPEAKAAILAENQIPDPDSYRGSTLVYQAFQKRDF